MSLPGFRNAIEVLREVAALNERNPALPTPRVIIDGNSKDGQKVEVYFYISSYCYEYHLTEAQRKEQVRLEIENTINTVVEAFGPDLDWVSNDPSESTHDKAHFTLAAEWRPGVTVRMLTQRDKIGEMVDTIDSGPQVITDGDTVQLVRQTATVWKPNISIGRRATPAYELEAAPLVLAVEA